MTSDKTPKSGASASRKTGKIAEIPAKGKAPKGYRLRGKSADAGTRESPAKGVGSVPGLRPFLRLSPAAEAKAKAKAMSAKARRASSGNVRQLPLRKPIHDGWGPFYDLAGAADLLRISPAKAKGLGEKHELLMVNTSDGGHLFPVWQFTGRSLHSRVAKTFTVFRDLQASPWLVVQWATAPNPQLGGATPVEWLNSNQPLDPVLEDARSYAARWSR
ncbi:hypothetical protein PV726_31455 [Streptomyces europaeiscabiei]|uniref:hypothetical protein n=1 Tax=Streptomyces europaeiscabiei TaxID=146819 RepID=UPI0029A90439|nr:hypothetical protein [Streptomyces europaeiscabiei]MDX3694772.1 hypothetical protein [Streptomyces europaeiscabiei]